MRRHAATTAPPPYRPCRARGRRRRRARGAARATRPRDWSCWARALAQHAVEEATAAEDHRVGAARACGVHGGVGQAVGERVVEGSARARVERTSSSPAPRTVRPPRRAGRAWARIAGATGTGSACVASFSKRDRRLGLEGPAASERSSDAPAAASNQRPAPLLGRQFRTSVEHGLQAARWRQPTVGEARLDLLAAAQRCSTGPRGATVRAPPTSPPGRAIGCRCATRLPALRAFTAVHPQQFAAPGAAVAAEADAVEPRPITGRRRGRASASPRRCAHGGAARRTGTPSRSPSASARRVLWKSGCRSCAIASTPPARAALTSARRRARGRPRRRRDRHAGRPGEAVRSSSRAARFFRNAPQASTRAGAAAGA